MTSLEPKVTTTILLDDPCKSPFSLTATDQTNPDDYYYTAEGVTFRVSPPIIDPVICPITYNCVSVDGPDADVRCDDKASVNFIASSGQLTFETLDIKKYSPGTYTFNL